MVASAVQVAKRALLATMRAVAVAFGMPMPCNRDSPDTDVVKTFRKLTLRAHPDKPGGGSGQLLQVFQESVSGGGAQERGHGP